jgi:hypothetical protein
MGTYGAPALTVTGSTLIATGSLLGTASYATTALSASYAPSTPAFPYTGSALITGSLGVTGSLNVTGGISATDYLQSQYIATSASVVVMKNAGISYITDFSTGGAGDLRFYYGGGGGWSYNWYTNNTKRVSIQDSGLYITNGGFDSTGTGRFGSNVTITGSASNSLLVKGSGTTSATTSFLVQNSAATELFKIRDDGSLFFSTGSITYGPTSGPGAGLKISLVTAWATAYPISIGNLNTLDGYVIGSINQGAGSGFVLGNNNTINVGTGFVLGSNNTQNTSNGNHIIIGSINTSNAYTNGQNASIIIGQQNNTNGYYGGGLFGSSLKYYANSQLVFGGNSGNVDFGIREVYFGYGVRNENYSVDSNNGHGPNISINTSQAYSGSGALNRNGGNITLRGGQGTGTGSAGDVIFTTAVTGSTGATYHSYTNRVWIKGHTGNVGIGTSTPNAQLDISGSTIITGSLTVTGGITGSITSASYALSASYAPSSPAFPYTGDAIITGSILARGLGSTNATTTLNIVNASGNNIIRGYDDGGIKLGNAVNQNQYINIGTAGNSIDFYTLNAHRFYVIDGTYSPAIAMYIKGAAGDPMVGIKTINPSYTLDVSGSGNFTNSLNVTGSLRVFSGSLTVGNITSTPSNENSLNVYPPLAGGIGEGGQILLAASGGLYSSASMIDTWQDQFRILRGSNTGGSNAGLVYVNLQSGNTQFTGAVTASAYSGLPNDYLYVIRRSSNQTIGSGTWADRDIIFDFTVVSKGIAYDTSTGLADLVGGKVYRITSRLAWSAAATYLLQYSCYDSSNNQIGPTVEIVQSTNSTNNISDGTLDFIYAPASNIRIKIRTTNNTTALTGEQIRNDLNTQFIIQQIA